MVIVSGVPLLLMIVLTMLMVFDRPRVGFAVDCYLQASAGCVPVAQGVAEGSIDDFKLRRRTRSVFWPLNRLQGVFHEFPVSEQLQGDLGQGDGNGLFCGSVEEVDRYRVRVLIVQQFRVVFFVPQFDEMSAVWAFCRMLMPGVRTVVVAGMVVVCVHDERRGRAFDLLG